MGDNYSNDDLTATPVHMSLSLQYNQHKLTKKILLYRSHKTRAFSFYIPPQSYTRKKMPFFNKEEI